MFRFEPQNYKLCARSRNASSAIERRKIKEVAGVRNNRLRS
jgi:hypothetical protein